MSHRHYRGPLTKPGDTVTRVRSVFDLACHVDRLTGRFGRLWSLAKRAAHVGDSTRALRLQGLAARAFLRARALAKRRKALQGLPDVDYGARKPVAG